MSKMITRSSLALLLVVVIGRTPSALAATEAGSHMVTGFVGSQFFDLGDNFRNAGTDFHTRVDLGGRYQYNLTDNWALEGSLLYSPGRTSLLGPVLTRDTVNTFYYAGNILYDFTTPGMVTPFATAGFGGASLDVKNGNVETFPAFNFGGGALVDVGDRAALRLDVRDYLYKANDLSSASLQVLELPQSFDKSINDLSVTAGLSWKF